jgi:small subunit ribosomal protein S18
MGKNSDKNSRRVAKETTKKVKKKVCTFCARKESWIDYKDADMLKRHMSDRGKIRARRVSGNCVQHQRDIAIAIKTARELALLPYTQRTVAERTRTRSPQRNEPEQESSFTENLESDDEDLTSFGPDDESEDASEVLA